LDLSYSKKMDSKLVAPVLNIKVSAAPVKNKFVKQAEVGCTTAELENKVKKSEDIDESTSIEREGWEITSTSTNSTEGKIQCQRCEQWVIDNPQLINSHQNSHSTKIIEYIYLGGERNAKNEKELIVRTDISYIINCATEVPNYFPEQFEYLKMELNDNYENNIIESFEKAFVRIDKARSEQKNILVHCIQGISRSASIVIGYLMARENYTLRRAYDFVKEKRTVVNPNPYFLQELAKYEKQLFGKGTLEATEIWCQCCLPPSTKKICGCKNPTNIRKD